MKISPFLSFDGYKVDHRRQYPKNTTMVLANMTARGSRVPGVKRVIFFGLQYYCLHHLIAEWNTMFFQEDIEKIVKHYNRRLENYLGPNQIGEQHIRDLHALGYLPLRIMALPEGSAVDLRVPMLVVYNTHPDFFWLTNLIETSMSATLWSPCTSATTASLYKQLLEKWAMITHPDNAGFVQWQGHDFSFRGHFTPCAAALSGAGHLLSFAGTDTLPAIQFLEDYYQADSDKELVGGSVAATEHSISCVGTASFMRDVPDEIDETYEYTSYVGYTGKLTEKDKLRLGELLMFKRLITEVYPTGIVSCVMDTYDFWNVVDPDNGIVATLKDVILAREGKVVIRPDTGDPVRIVAGYTEDEITRDGDKIYTQGTHDKPRRYITELEVKGMIQCLWEIFGGGVTKTGFKVLDPHVGAIYGDSITLERAEKISACLHAKGFASTNVVFGVGSFAYVGAVTPEAIITRDTHGFAVKATYAEIKENGETIGLEIFKDPSTDDGLKKSAKGITAVYPKEGGGYYMKDEATWDELQNCALQPVFENGRMLRMQTLEEIRGRVSAFNNSQSL